MKHLERMKQQTKDSIKVLVPLAFIAVGLWIYLAFVARTSMAGLMLLAVIAFVILLYLDIMRLIELNRQSKQAETRRKEDHDAFEA